MFERRAFLVMLTLGLLAPGLSAVAGEKNDNNGGGSGGGTGGGGIGSGGGNGNGNGNGGGSSNGQGRGRTTGDADSGSDNEEERIRSAVRRGEAEPLRKILAVVRERYSGKVVRISLAGQGNGLHYRIRILGPDNRLFEVRVSARTASILGAAGI